MSRKNLRGTQRVRPYGGWNTDYRDIYIWEHNEEYGHIFYTELCIDDSILRVAEVGDFMYESEENEYL